MKSIAYWATVIVLFLVIFALVQYATCWWTSIGKESAHPVECTVNELKKRIPD